MAVKCPQGHTKVWKKGKMPTRQGPKQRYVCFTCGATFYADGSEKPKSKSRKRR